MSARCGIKDSLGFTLVEVMIALMIGAIVLAAVSTSFQSQHQTYLAQDLVVETHQNARVAMDLLVRDIRSAGYDPNDLGLGVTSATSTALTFTRYNEDAAATETIEYTLYDAYSDSDNDLGRKVDAGAKTAAAENIKNIEFRYLDENDAVTADLDKIRAIQVSIMAQSSKKETKLTPVLKTYTTPGGVNWTSDAGYWSVFLTTTVKCRNLGL